MANRAARTVCLRGRAGAPCPACRSRLSDSRCGRRRERSRASHSSCKRVHLSRPGKSCRRCLFRLCRRTRCLSRRRQGPRCTCRRTRRTSWPSRCDRPDRPSRRATSRRTGRRSVRARGRGPRARRYRKTPRRGPADPLCRPCLRSRCLRTACHLVLPGWTRETAPTFRTRARSRARARARRCCRSSGSRRRLSGIPTEWRPGRTSETRHKQGARG